jgi:hypothetical protein
MKKLISTVVAVALVGLSGVVIADTEEVGVPIAVQNGSYTVVSNPDYYYYTGHRCYVERRPGVGVNVLGLRAGVGGGRKIYCYPN